MCCEQTSIVAVAATTASDNDHSQPSQMDPRDAVRHADRAVHQGGRSVT